MTRHALAAIAMLLLAACTREDLIGLESPNVSPDAGSAQDAGASCDEESINVIQTQSDGLSFDIPDIRVHAPQIASQRHGRVTFSYVNGLMPTNDTFTSDGLRTTGTLNILSPAEDWALPSRHVVFVDQRTTIAWYTGSGVGRFAAPPGTTFGEVSALGMDFVAVSYGPLDPLRLHIAHAIDDVRTVEVATLASPEAADVRLFSEPASSDRLWLSYGEGESVAVFELDPDTGAINREHHVSTAGCRADNQIVRVKGDQIFISVRCGRFVKRYEASFRTDDVKSFTLSCDARALAPAMELHPTEDPPVMFTVFWRENASGPELRTSLGEQILLTGFDDGPRNPYGLDVTFDGFDWIAGFIDNGTGFIRFHALWP